MHPTTPPTPPCRAPRAPKNPRRRVRSESDRKKHAGWRHCPRCNRSVSTNGRNFYHHMHKCDRVFFADLIAKVDTARAPVSTPLPPPAPRLTNSPITPNHPSARGPVRMSEMQRVVFLQQLCFLRVYDRTVDAVFRQLEQTDASVFSTAVFEAVRRAKRRDTPHTAPHHSKPFSPPSLPLGPPAHQPHPPPPVPDNLTLPAISAPRDSVRASPNGRSQSAPNVPIQPTTQPLAHQTLHSNPLATSSATYDTNASYRDNVALATTAAAPSGPLPSSVATNMPVSTNAAAVGPPSGPMLRNDLMEMNRHSTGSISLPLSNPISGNGSLYPVSNNGSLPGGTGVTADAQTLLAGDRPLQGSRPMTAAVPISGSMPLAENMPAAMSMPMSGSMHVQGNGPHIGSASVQPNGSVHPNSALVSPNVSSDRISVPGSSEMGARHGVNNQTWRPDPPSYHGSTAVPTSSNTVYGSEPTTAPYVSAPYTSSSVANSAVANTAVSRVASAMSISSVINS